MVRKTKTWKNHLNLLACPLVNCLETIAKNYYYCFAGVARHKNIEGISKGITKTTLKKIEGITEGIKDKMTQMLALLYNNGGIRTVDMEEQLEIPTKSLERYIKTLRDAGLIEFKGASRSGGYYLTRKIQTKLK